MNAVASNTMTVRQLRVILFEFADQQMTIEQLRKKLFDVEEQDKEVEVSAAFWAIAHAERSA